MWWIIGIAVLVVLFMVNTFQKDKAKNKDKENLLSKGINPGDLIFGGAYLGGITDVTKQYSPVKFLRTSAGLDLYATIEGQYGSAEYSFETIKIGSIQNSEIKSVTVEDKSSSEKRMSVGNIALFGPLGLAMRKTKNKDLALLIIKTSDGRFESDAIFSFTTVTDNTLGGAFKRANECRSKLIQHLKTLT